jgi:hypothetical protein
MGMGEMWTQQQQSHTLHFTFDIMGMSVERWMDVMEHGWCLICVCRCPTSLFSVVALPSILVLPAAGVHLVILRQGSDQLLADVRLLHFLLLFLLVPGSSAILSSFTFFSTVGVLLAAARTEPDEKADDSQAENVFWGIGVRRLHCLIAQFNGLTGEERRRR